MCPQKNSLLFESENQRQELAVIGHLPEWLKGIYIRNGPVYVEVGGQSLTHWFDGLAMLHAFSFQNGRIFHTNRFLRTKSYSEVFEEKHLPYNGFAEDPCRSLFKRFFSLFFSHQNELKNANVNVAKYADHYVALTEIPLPVVFDPQTLETLGVHTFTDSLPTSRCWESAHPHVHKETNEAINYLIEYGSKSFYVVYKLDREFKERKVIARIPVKEPCYMHSFAVTARFAILVEFPFVVKPLDLLLKGKAFIKNYYWDETRGTKIKVINLKTGQVDLEVKTESLFAFHHVNAFEEEGEIHLDMICYPDADIVMSVKDHFRPGKKANSSIEDNFKGIQFKRLSLSFDQKTVTQKTLFQGSIEFPRINDFYDGSNYTYAYAVDPREPSLDDKERAIYKINTRTSEVLKWSEKNCFPGEPFFVPHPQNKTEDDGVILNIVMDLERKNSFLLGLDGATISEIFRVYSPSISPGLHGQYLPSF